MKKKIVVINGSGGVGKDTFIQCCKKIEPVQNISSVDKVKEAARILVGWKNEKDEKARKLLADLKKLATEYNDAPYRYIKDSIKHFLQSDENTILFLHVREIEQIKRLQKEFDIITLLVKNIRIKEITSNTSDANVSQYNYNYIIENNGTIEELQQKASHFISSIFNEKLSKVN